MASYDENGDSRKHKLDSLIVSKARRAKSPGENQKHRMLVLCSWTESYCWWIIRSALGEGSW
jgi:hypothetical protein